MFLKNIGLIKKNIGTFENKHTVDCLRTYGPLVTNSYRLKTNDRYSPLAASIRRKINNNKVNPHSEEPP